MNAKISVSFWLLALIAVSSYVYNETAVLLSAAFIHEMAHIAAILALGGKIERIDLTLSKAEIVPRFKNIVGVSKDAIVIISGPAAGAAAGLLFLLIGVKTAAAANLAMASLNLLPLSGLDGGAFCKLLYGKSGRAAAAMLLVSAALGALALYILAPGINFKSFLA